MNKVDYRADYIVENITDCVTGPLVSVHPSGFSQVRFARGVNMLC